ncbi:hypothetical protein V496_08457, partial [Pseudogymnoascus sp. VKM F-4515 (FW-2607)]
MATAANPLTSNITQGRSPPFCPPSVQRPASPANPAITTPLVPGRQTIQQS